MNNDVSDLLQTVDDYCERQLDQELINSIDDEEITTNNFGNILFIIISTSLSFFSSFWTTSLRSSS